MKKAQVSGLEFKNSMKALTLGVEMELQVLDPNELLLTPRASEIIDACKHERVVQEFFQSTLEIVSDICPTVQHVAKDMGSMLQKVRGEADKVRLKLASTGTHPMADYRERLVTQSPRYHELIDRNQWLIRRMAVYGMHVHLGMTSGDACIRYNYFFMNFLPHILALSGSSPFWQGMYTGLSSCRPTTYEALPTAGMPYLVQDWNEFQKLYQFLVKSKAIQSMKDVWWDLRPSPGHGTLELRFCDQPATLAESLAIIAFVHTLAHWFSEHEAEWTKAHNPLKKWIFRENKWRAIRFGLDAEIVTTRSGSTTLLRKDIREWLHVLTPYAAKLQYQGYMSVLEEILEKGNSSTRQYAVFKNTNDLQEVIRHNVMEFESGQPIWVDGSGSKSGS